MSAIFWLSAVMLFYVFFGYPLLIWLWSGARARPVLRNLHEPEISVLLVAHNEQATIRTKLTSLLAMDYPLHKVEIVVASDASNDETDNIIREFSTRGVVIRTSVTQRGKPANLNEWIPQLRGSIVILMDARQEIGSGFVRALVRNFGDPTVGAVSGELVLQPQSEGTQEVASGVGFYWRYEKFLRRMESNVDSSVGATGALYAIRKSVFKPIASDTLLDDLLIPMNIVRQGYRVLFEPDALAFDSARVSAESEFRRKVRTIAGNFQLFSRETWLLNPVVNRLWLQTLSHKFLRLTAPLFLVLLMLSNLFLLSSPFFLMTFLIQLIFYGAACIGIASSSLGYGNRAFAIPYAFCMLNWATVIGFMRFMFKQQRVIWK